MKFRSRMVLAYTTVALIASLALGVILGQTALKYERDIQKDNLRISAQSYVTQVDETLDRMNAITQYILSSPNILDGITTLSISEELDMDSAYIREAVNAIQLGMSTTYVRNNSYQTVYFNEYAYFASAVKYVVSVGEVVPVQKLRTGFSMEDISYLSDADIANGGIIIVPAHMDYWQVDGEDIVFSLVKKIRGEGMGYIEVEKRIEDLAELESSDPAINYVIRLDSGKLLYSSEMDSAELMPEWISEVSETEQNEVVNTGDYLYTEIESDNYGYSIFTYIPGNAFAGTRSHVFGLSLFAALLLFGTSLALIIYFSGLLTRPIRIIQDVVENTSLENLKEDPKVEMNDGPEEFRELLNSYQNMTSRLNLALKNEKRSSVLQLQAQFDMLQTQVNPHFIYNVLNIISSRAVMADDEVICEMCGCLGNMLRYSTNNKERYSTIEQEAAYLNDYFYLLKARYEDRLEVGMDISNDVRKVTVPKMTLLPLIENSIKHGYHDTDTHMKVEVIAAMGADRWTITVQDNGSGVEEERLEEIKDRLAKVKKRVLEKKEVPTEAEIGGLGLINTYARGLLLYQEDYIFELRNRTHQPGFSVTIGAKNINEEY